MGKSKKTIKITVCPVCGSTNIRKVSQFSGWLMPEEYICLDCGYRGPIVAEIEVDVDEDQTELRSFGEYYEDH